MIEWSELKAPNKEVGYEHVVAKTPLGQITIEWLYWREGDSKVAEMPWGDFVSGETFDQAKVAVQASWDEMVPRLAAFTSRAQGDPA